MNDLNKKNELGDELETLSGAYSLNALDADEARAFEAALADSEQARNEVTELRDTAVLLGLAVAPVQPSAGLKANIMDLLESTPQLPAEEEHEIATEPTRPEYERPAAARARSRWFTKPATIVTSLAAAAALILGGVVVSGNVRDMQEQNLAADKLAQISAADDAQNVVAPVTSGGTATVTWSNELAAASVTVKDIASLPADKIYELWYIDGNGARPAGTFSASDSGTTWAVLDGDMNAGDTIGVTVEPAGGSETPTTDPILVVTTA